MTGTGHTRQKESSMHQKQSAKGLIARPVACEVGQASANTLTIEENATQGEYESLDVIQGDISTDPAEDMKDRIRAAIEKFNRRHCSKHVR